MVEQGEDAVREEQGGRGDAGVDQQEEGGDDLVVAQPAVRQQRRDQVVGGLGTAPGDQVLGVLHDAGQPFGDPAAVAVREVPDPPADPVLVGRVDPDQLADHGRTQRVGELTQQIDLFALGEVREKGAGALLHEGAQRGHPAGGEGAGERAASPGVLVAVEERQMPQQVRDVLRGEALHALGQQLGLRVRHVGAAGDGATVPDQARLGERGPDVLEAGQQPHRGVQTRQDRMADVGAGTQVGVAADGVLDEFGGEVQGVGHDGGLSAGGRRLAACGKPASARFHRGFNGADEALPPMVSRPERLLGSCLRPREPSGP